jgi:hypothetical protein
MAENDKKNKGTLKPPDKSLKPKFNSNWVFAILIVSFLAINLFYGGSKTITKVQIPEIKKMITNRDIERSY